MPMAATSAPTPLPIKSRPLYVASPNASRAVTRWMSPVARMAAIASHFTVGDTVVIGEALAVVEAVDLILAHEARGAATTLSRDPDEIDRDKDSGADQANEQA